MKRKILMLVVLLTGFSSFLFAQQTITGNVVDKADNSPIIGVSVYEKGTTNGTVTDFDGNYSLSVSGEESTIVFSFIGYVSIEKLVGTLTSLNVVMKSDTENLEEVVVVGYGTQKKSHLTGAISKVVNENMEQVAVARVDDALVGRISGVNIQATDGGAGTAPTIRIRGTGSISGSSSPLIVVDGIVVDADYLGNLDMNDVASFEVLKDAASAAIYGSRGANGVIMITSKEGKAGKTKFNYNSYIGFKEARISDAYDFSLAETAAAELAANGVLSAKTQYKQMIGVDRPWTDVIFDGGTIQNHSISARGGNENTKFSTALNYLHDEGVLLTDDYKKYGLKLKLDTKISDKFSLGVNLSPTYSDRRRFDGSTHDILRQTVWLPTYITDDNIQYVDKSTYPDVKVGDYAKQRHFDNYMLNGEEVDISNTSNVNPYAKIKERDYTYKKLKLYGSVYAKYKIMKGLNFKTTIGGSFQNTDVRRWQGPLAHRNGASNTQLFESNTNSIHLVNDNFFSYSKRMGDHDISAILGVSVETWETEFSSANGTDYAFDYIKNMSAAGTISSAESGEYEDRLLSFTGRVNYAFKDKYLASVSYRRDGSSRFGADTKYGDFTAFSVGWRLTQEDFLVDNDVIDNLKLRFSYGVTGNNAIDASSVYEENYPYLALLETSSAIVNGSAATGFNAINISNPDLGWEKSVEFNPGLDFTLLGGLLSGSVDYYKRTSEDLILSNPVSWTTGFDAALINRGEVENSGIELELRSRVKITNDLTWTGTFIASKNKNKLTDFAESNGQIQSVDSKRAAEWINQEGKPISSFYGWVVDKDIPLEYINNPYHPVGAEAQDVYVKDLNGDGIIDDEDKAILGNPYPELIWSFSSDFKYKNFDFSFMFQGSHGAEVRNMGDQYMFNQFNSSQDFDPTITPNQEFIKQKIFTDDIVQDASYIALRNVNIGYSFGNELLGRTFIEKARVYVSAQNLLYFTADNYTGYNPESVDSTSPTTYGYQRAGSPIYRTISVGVNLDF
ncbi:TonB-dependent receptor [Ancylomarina sp. 16SWW S1-10-2]|uniref:SusC/RagA family TonB-linked outer membrane protein n=1 Tax=Ancylomarina sp. 16SWW S1-10-2 TaxID=2499681 RepID=UPI0012AE69E4|nr:TonB-dependent receptor [Ancylomarina sp. 16SWW S1-10-2]MRT92503.1 TonB-dependent receptor [Ancylomarina sp. 16SWW S1-10-2]